jgi:ribosomal protein S24E
MTLKILATKENPLLKRKEISATLVAMKSPSNEEIKEKIAQQSKADKELIVIKDIRGSFGSDNFSISAFVYHTKKDMDETEPKPKIKTIPGQAPAAPAKK